MLYLLEFLRTVYGIWFILLLVVPFTSDAFSLALLTASFFILVLPATLSALLLVLFLPWCIFYTYVIVTGGTVCIFTQWILIIFVQQS